MFDEIRCSGSRAHFPKTAITRDSKLVRRMRSKLQSDVPVSPALVLLQLNRRIRPQKTRHSNGRSDSGTDSLGAGCLLPVSRAAGDSLGFFSRDLDPVQKEHFRDLVLIDSARCSSRAYHRGYSRRRPFSEVFPPATMLDSKRIQSDRGSKTTPERVRRERLVEKSSENGDGDGTGGKEAGKSAVNGLTSGHATSNNNNAGV